MFKKFKMRHWLMAFGALVLTVAGTAGFVAFRAKRSYDILRDWQAQARHQAATGGSIGTAPAARTFEAAYLEVVFGHEPTLIPQMKALIAKGLAEEPLLNMGEVAAMIATYSKSPQGAIEDVAIHVMGNFEVGKRKPGFNKDGYFAAHLDRNLFQAGNNIIGLLGRDLVVFADEKSGHMHQKVREAVLGGDIMPFVGMVTNQPVHFIAVFPDPKRVMPTQLRPHIQTCIFRGFLSEQAGRYEVDFMNKDSRSALYSLSIINDLKLASMLALRTRLGGTPQKTAWGNHVSTWWAFQMAETLDSASLEKTQNVVRITTDFKRTMVNASIKAVERLGRDVAAMRMIREDRLDPRIVDDKLKSSTPLNYWGEAHRWGPDWPAAPLNTNNLPEAPAGTAPAASVDTTPTPQRT